MTLSLNRGARRFADVNGHGSAIGEIDFNTGHAVLRYLGKVCQADKD
jgi:hypothetical protein